MIIFVTQLASLDGTACARAKVIAYSCDVDQYS
jgi:hypothetical protein